MQSPISLAALTLLASPLLAQVNPFLFYPQDPERQTVTCTSFVGRPHVSNAGEALMEMDIQHFRGVGDSNGAFVRLFGIYHWLADEKLSTTETYGLIVRNGSTTGPGPDMSQGAEFLRINGLTSPPSTNPNRGTWIMSDGFGLTSQGGLHLPPTDPSAFAPPRYYVGVVLPANPLWPATDGHSLFRADLLNAGTGATLGENHRAGAPRPTWAGLAAPGISFATPWTYILGPFVTSPNLHIGGLDPTSLRLGAPGANFSMNGLFPDISGAPRRDGLVMRITDNLAPFGLVFLGGAVGFQVPYFEFGLIGTLIGHSFIGDNSTAVPLGVTALNNGAREVTIALPNTISPTLVGTNFVFQSIVWDANIHLAEWTNAQVVHL